LGRKNRVHYNHRGREGGGRWSPYCGYDQRSALAAKVGAGRRTRIGKEKTGKKKGEKLSSLT